MSDALPPMVHRIASVLDHPSCHMGGPSRQNVRTARAVLEAMRDIENDTLAAGYEAMFTDKWDGTQAPMMGAGWNAMIDKALETVPAQPAL